MTSELEALSFTPKAGQPNTKSTSTFSLSDKSSAYATAAVDSKTTVIDTDPAFTPTISETFATLTINSSAAVKPFTSVTIGDASGSSTDPLTVITTGASGILSGERAHRRRRHRVGAGPVFQVPR